MTKKSKPTHYFYVTETLTAKRGREIRNLKFEGSCQECRKALNDYKIEHAEFVYNARPKLGVAKFNNTEIGE